MFNFDPVFMHNLDDQRNFPLNDDDVVVVGFPKSGTSWFQVMLTNLYDDWGNHAIQGSKVPSLHGVDRSGAGMTYYGYQAALALQSPRLLKSHLHRELFPRRWPEHGKVVHMTRNPKDCCVSLYFDLQSARAMAPAGQSMPRDFDHWVQMFCAGAGAFGPFVDSVAGWWNFEHPNLHKVVYEDIRHDARPAIERVIEFLGKPVDQARLDEVLEKARFENMRQNEYRFQVNHIDLREGTDEPFVRKGKIGGWRDYLTPGQSARLDRDVVTPLEKLGIHLNYG